MVNSFLIRGKDKDNGDFLYLAIDSHSGGYPFWTPSTNQALKLELGSLSRTSVEITSAFKRKSGVYYKDNISLDSLEFVKIALIQPTSCSSFKEEDVILESIKNKLSDEEFEFLKKNTIKGKQNG